MGQRELNFNIIQQGAINVNNNFAFIEKEHYDVITCSIDLKSKYVNILSYEDDEDIAPIIKLYADEDTIKINENLIDKATVLEFPTIKGWKVWQLTRGGKYTIKITFTLN